jgi:hypothetical protein
MIDFLVFIPKAKYYSQKRKKKVTFDLAIEVWTTGAKRYVMVYLIECKSSHIRAFYEIVNKLAYRYYVSKTTIIYKLYEMNLINNQSRLKSVGQLVDEYTEGNIS